MSINTNKVKLSANNQVSWNIDIIALSVAGSVLEQIIYLTMHSYK